MLISSFWLQFQYADWFDWLLIFFGSFFGAGHGVFLPVVMIIFGDAIALLADSTTIPAINSTNATGLPNITSGTAAPTVDPLAGLTEQMGDQAIQYCGLAVGVLGATYIQVIHAQLFSAPVYCIALMISTCIEKFSS